MELLLSLGLGGIVAIWIANGLLNRHFSVMAHSTYLHQKSLTQNPVGAETPAQVFNQRSEALSLTALIDEIYRQDKIRFHNSWWRVMGILLLQLLIYLVIMYGIYFLSGIASAQSAWEEKNALQNSLHYFSDNAMRELQERTPPNDDFYMFFVVGLILGFLPLVVINAIFAVFGSLAFHTDYWRGIRDPKLTNDSYRLIDDYLIYHQDDPEAIRLFLYELQSRGMKKAHDFAKASAEEFGNNRPID